MKTHLRRLLWVCLSLLCCFLFAHTQVASADPPPKTITSSVCGNLSFSSIPVGNFKSPLQMPEDKIRITQKYNTTKAEGFYHEGQLMYGHDGLDLHEKGAPSGKNNVYSVQPGIVVASHHYNRGKGWGESMIVATRSNLYAEEILTFHYHHLHFTGSLNNTYQPTRRFNACEKVKAGEVLAKEGGSGGWPTHLHFGIRRWKNLAALKSAIKNDGLKLYGHGYTFGNNSKIENHLDPETILFDIYEEFVIKPGKPMSYAWAQPYVVAMKSTATEFGLFDGSFGAANTVKRREAARWIKTAAERVSSNPPQPTFPDDLPLTDPDSGAVEALTFYPPQQPVVNPNTSCQQGVKKFCPEAGVKRVEALKMIVLAFYADEYFKIYNDYIWGAAKNQAMALLTTFQDVDPFSWYASYLYFGLFQGIVQDQQYFHPAQLVTRAELSKWIMLGYTHKQGNSNSPCANKLCSQNFYCDQQYGVCLPLAACVPSETQSCEAGGGYDPCGQYKTCSPGEKKYQLCANNSGLQEATCTNQCHWGEWGECEPIGNCLEGEQAPCGNCGMATCNQSGEYGFCQEQGQCSPGVTKQQSCNGNGIQQKICDNKCQWSAWSGCSVNCVCDSGPCCDGCNYLTSFYPCNSYDNYQCEGQNPGDDAVKIPTTVYCSGVDSACNGQIVELNPYQVDACSDSEACQIVGGIPKCVLYDGGNSSGSGASGSSGSSGSSSSSSSGSGGSSGSSDSSGAGGNSSSAGSGVGGGSSSSSSSSSGSGGGCQDVYNSSSSEECYNNPQNQSNPVLCLKVQKISGADFKYQICKQGGSFQNDLTYQLRDDSYLVFFDTYSGNSGTTCTPWKNFTVSYLSGYGYANGAGIVGGVTSPAGCNFQDCKYKTGLINVYKTCQ